MGLSHLYHCWFMHAPPLLAHQPSPPPPLLPSGSSPNHPSPPDLVCTRPAQALCTRPAWAVWPQLLLCLVASSVSFAPSVDKTRSLSQVSCQFASAVSWWLAVRVGGVVEVVTDWAIAAITSVVVSQRLPCLWDQVSVSVTSVLVLFAVLSCGCRNDPSPWRYTTLNEGWGGGGEGGGVISCSQL